MPDLTQQKWRRTKIILDRLKLTERPNTFIIGTQKSGTSSLHDYLAGQEKVLTAGRKEIDFWHFEKSTQAKKWNYSIDTYNFCFPRAIRGTKRLLDSTPHYCTHPAALKRIHEFNAQSKIILLLRNPLSRMISAHNMCQNEWKSIEHHKNLGNFETRSLNNALNQELNPEIPFDSRTHPMFIPDYYSGMSMYSKIIKDVRHQFPRENILIGIFETDLLSDFSVFRDKLSSFLDIELFGDTLPQSKAAKSKPKKETLSREVIEFVQREIRETEKLLELDLTVWKNALQQP